MKNVIRKIHVIPYCHTDYAWTNPRTWHISRYLEAYRQILALSREHGDYTAVLDNVVHSLVPFLRYCPQALEEMRELVRSGRWDVCPGGWSLVRPNQVGEETFVRNLEAADREFRRLFGEDISIETCFNADTAMGHSQLPQLLRLMGYKYYQFQRPDLFLNRKGVPKQFRWRGLDGSEILAARGLYCGFADGWYAKPGCDADWESRKAGFYADELNSRLENQTTPLLQVFQGVDDMLPGTNRVDEPIDLWGFFRDWNEHESSKMEFSTITRYFHALEQLPLETLTGCVEPHDVTYNLYSKGTGSLRWLRQALDKRLTTLETVYAMLKANGGEAPSFAEMDKKWKEALEITGHAMEFIFRQDWKRVYSAVLGQYLTLGEELERAKEALADLVSCGSEDETIVINPNGFAVTQSVTVNVSSAMGLRAFALLDDTGAELPWQYLTVNSPDKAYTSFRYSAAQVETVVTVPAYGVRILHTKWQGGSVDWLSVGEKQRLAVPMDAAHVETLDYTMTVGGRTALFQNGLLVGFGRDGSSEARPTMQLRFVETAPSDNWLFDVNPVAESRFVPERGEVVTHGPVLASYRVYGTLGGTKTAVTYTLGKIPGLLTMEIEMERGEKNGYFAADFACDENTPLAADLPFGWEEKDGAALWNVDTQDEFVVTLKGQFHAKSWASFRRGGVSRAAISRDLLLYWQYAPEEKRVSLLLNKVVTLAENPYGRLDSWKYHENTGANQRTDTYAIALTAGGEGAAERSRIAMAYKRPLETAQSWNRIGRTPAEPIFTPLEGEICTTALYEKDGARYVRFWECGGKGGTLRARLQSGAKTAEKTDLRGRVLAPCTVENGVVTLPMGPFEIITLKIL